MLSSLDTFATFFLVGIALYALYVLLPAILLAVQRLHLIFVKDPVTGTTGPAVPPLGPGPPEVRDLTEMLETLRRRYKVPALAAGVVQDLKLAALGAVGVRRAGHAERISSHDCFHLGSCTKAMTATLCALLVEQNQHRWNSTIAEVFPELATEIGAGYRVVTLEQLLAHRSGFTEGFTFLTTLWPKIWKLQGPLDEQRRSLIKLVLQGEPRTLPGTKYAYSNCGYTIAGAMCERVSGRPGKISCATGSLAHSA